MNSHRAGKSTLVLLLILAFFLSACGSGVMKVRETHYFAVSNGTNTNYYRLLVKATTRVGEAEYRSGWFPARSVDGLFGEVTAESGADALDVRTKLERQINNAILTTHKAWLEEAAKAKPDTFQLGGLMQARRRILAYPQHTGDPFPNAFEIEYNPAQGVAIRYADEKLIFVLSSNPDEVIGKIASFTENEKTILTIKQFANAVAQRNMNEVAALEAREETNTTQQDAMVLAQLRRAQDVANSSDPEKDDILREIDILLKLIDNLNQ